jgi:hypothetical protein
LSVFQQCNFDNNFRENRLNGSNVYAEFRKNQLNGLKFEIGGTQTRADATTFIHKTAWKFQGFFITFMRASEAYRNK